MNMRDVYEYYSREDIRKALFELAQSREVVGVFKNGAFGARPNTILYPQDIPNMVKSGVVEFHSSIERWSNPMALRTDNYDDMRTGWDLILDLDCKDMEHGKVATQVFVNVLKKHGVVPSVKFTGNNGFHMGISWESMPKEADYKQTVGMFPELARNAVYYLKEFVRDDLEKALLKKFSVEQLAKQSGKKIGDFFVGDNVDPFKIVDVDTVLLSPRHMYRMPYSLHHKTFLVSLPIHPGDLEDFKREHAEPSKVKVAHNFLSEKGDSSLLLSEVLDWTGKQTKEKKRLVTRKFEILKKVPLDHAPPCVQNILTGLEDGRKRSVFIITNFLSSLKWTWEEIETKIVEWNMKNKPPLSDNYIRMQVRWHKNRDKAILPPNCIHKGWYVDIGVCKPDQTCGGQKKTVKNPVNYSIKKLGLNKSKGKYASKLRRNTKNS
ncbi:MAG: hypothetical protein ABIH52_03155 [Candidatus Aenigmatarchaeota archaeon]|nr:hypothetical protein [Nanoarchaeota archaeon]